MEFSPIWRRIQRSLFPRIEDCLGPLTEEHRKIVAILEIVRIEDQIRQSRRGQGVPRTTGCRSPGLLWPKRS